MTEPGRIDLSPLEPDPTRWRALVDSTLTRVESAMRQRRVDPLTLIASWTRPLLIGASAMVLILIPVELTLEVRERKEERVDRLVALSARIDRLADAPSGADFRRALVEAAQP